MSFHLLDELETLDVSGGSLNVDYGILALKKPVVAATLASNEAFFHEAEDTIQNELISRFGDRHYRIRLSNLPDTTPIADLARGSYERRIVQFKGIVTMVQPVKKLTRYKRYQCRFKNYLRECFAPTLEDMLDSTRMPKATVLYGYCPQCGREGKRKVPLDLIKESCVFIPSQKIAVQETMNEIGSGRVPVKVTGYMLDDLACDVVVQGEQIMCVGIIYSDFKGGVYAEILSIVKLSASTEVSISIQDEDAIRALAARPDIYDMLVDSYAPIVYDHNEIKLALLCSLVGSPRIDALDEYGEPAGVKIRGDINTILAGDPGTAKSMLINQAGFLNPRPVYASGGRASEAGLTCSVIRGKDDAFELKPGAAVLADDGGICIIDEFEKIKEVDRQSIHKPMEDQFCPVTMAGVTEILNTREPWVAACNPIKGRYDPNKTLLENINLDSPILSRFDIIFVVRDSPVEKTERELSLHMLKSHSNVRQGSISLPLLKKYISFCKRINPVLEEDSEAFRILHEGYIHVRFEDSEGRIPPTPRVQQSLIRVAMALARMQLSGRVEANHAQMALDMFKSTVSIHSLDPELKQYTQTTLPASDEITANRVEAIKTYLFEEAGKFNGKVVKTRVSRKFPDMKELIDDVIEDLMRHGEVKDGGLFWEMRSNIV